MSMNGNMSMKGISPGAQRRTEGREAARAAATKHFGSHGTFDVVKKALSGMHQGGREEATYEENQAPWLVQHPRR